MIDVKQKDPQKQTVYENNLCGNIKGETISHDGAKAIRQALWEKHVNLPLKEPNLKYITDSESNHEYDAWDHKITLDCSKSNVKISKLLHELAHAKLGAFGIGPFVETHGPIFLLVFGRMWSTFAAKPQSEFFQRCEDLNLQVSDSFPENLEQSSWAIVRENGKEYAVRPSQKAVQMGWNIAEIFNTKIAEKHPMGINNT